MRILGRTDLSIADGMPLVWGSRWLGTPLPERVTGADLVPALVERAARSGYRVYFFGAAPTVAAAAADVLRERYPGAEIVADARADVRRPCRHGPGRARADQGGRPDICCVALGNPKQELWIDRFGADVGAPVVIGVGGTLDFVSGAKRRAPEWAQRFGLEWVHRAVTEPRRLIRRYARDLIVFAPRLARQVWATRPGRTVGAGVHDVERGADIATVWLGGTARPLDEHEWREVEIAVEEDARIVIDFTGRGRIGGRDIATVVEIARLAARSGVAVELAHVGASTRRQLVAVRLAHLLDQPIRGLPRRPAR